MKIVNIIANILPTENFGLYEIEDDGYTPDMVTMLFLSKKYGGFPFSDTLLQSDKMRENIPAIEDCDEVYVRIGTSTGFLRIK